MQSDWLLIMQSDWLLIMQSDWLLIMQSDWLLIMQSDWLLIMQSDWLFDICDLSARVNGVEIMTPHDPVCACVCVRSRVWKSYRNVCTRLL